MASILADAGVAILFVGKGFAEVVAALDLPATCRCISVNGASDRWPDFAAWCNAQSTAEPAAPIDPETTVIQMYTSGTTGLPKGVELNSRSLIAVLRAAEEGGVGDVGPEDVLLACLPLFHIAGTNVGLIGLSHGARVIVMEEYDPAVVVDIIPRHRVTFTLLVPAAIQLLVQHPKTATADFGSVRILAYGASPIAETLVDQARAVFSKAGFWHLYGLTETSGGGTFLPPAGHSRELGKLRSCGKPYPGFELRIVDPLGKDVRAGEVGEILLRSSTLMKGYWNNPAATRASFLGDGWLRTGDAAYIDADGFVYVHDRVKDMIITGGENVFPAEVENALFSHPAVADVAAIGVPDQRWGEAVKAFVVRRAEFEVTADAIIAHARERIARFKVPKSVEFVERLPRNAAGKLLRRTLRAPYWEGRERMIG
jgi:fatty-acyl-CoA synthase